MNFTARDYIHEINVNNMWHKYDSPQNLERITTFLVGAQWLPSQTTVERAIAHLQLPRTDGRNAKDDARDIRVAAQRNYNDAAAEADRIPLTPKELAEFASLSHAELQRRYYGEDGLASDFFSIRYRKAAREFGYRIPGKPKPAEAEDDDAVRLTAAEYHSMPAQTILRRMRDPGFKRAVEKLVEAAAI